MHLVAVIVNATQLDRQLALPLQAKELGIPLVLLINMQDEARRLGANFVAAPAFRPHAVRDGNLITGQQQYSGRAAALLVIEALGR